MPGTDGLSRKTSKQPGLSFIAAAVLTLAAVTAVAPPALGESEATEFEEGQQCFRDRQFISAVRHLNAAITANPANVMAHYLRGMATLELKDKEGALQDFEYCQKNAPKIVIKPSAWARAYRASGNLDRAVACYAEAIKAEPRFGCWNVERAQAYCEQDHFDLALPDYTAAIKKEPNEDNHYSERADCYMQLKAPAKALPDLNQAIRLNPQSKSHYLRRGICEEELGKLKEAIADYSTVIQSKPGEAKAYALRAKAYDKMGRKDLADADRKKARELGDLFTF